MRFPFFRNRDSVKNGILISIRRTGDGFHPGLFNYPKEQLEKFSHYVFGVDYAVIMGILEMKKGSDRPCRKCESTF